LADDGLEEPQPASSARATNPVVVNVLVTVAEWGQHQGELPAVRLALVLV
jgi:hypothetical protein